MCGFALDLALEEKVPDLKLLCRADELHFVQTLVWLCGVLVRAPSRLYGFYIRGGRGQKVGPIDRGVRRSIYVFA